MQVSQQVLEWQAQARQEGEQKGQLTAARECLLDALQLRCHGPIPADLLATIQEISDSRELKRWFNAALRAESLDAFREAVVQPVIVRTNSA